MGTAWKVLAWLFFGLLGLIVVGWAGLMLSMSIAADRQEDMAREAVVALTNAINEELRESIRDGELADQEIARVPRSCCADARRVTRSADKIEIIYHASASVGGPMLFGASAETCTVFEVPLPITPDRVVKQHEIDKCPPPVYPTDGGRAPTKTASP